VPTAAGQHLGSQHFSPHAVPLPCAAHTHTLKSWRRGNSWDRNTFLRPRHAQNPNRVLIDAAKREVLLPASVTRRCRVRPSLCTSDGGLLLLHAVKRRFREPGCTLWRDRYASTGIFVLLFIGMPRAAADWNGSIEKDELVQGCWVAQCCVGDVNSRCSLGPKSNDSVEQTVLYFGADLYIYVYYFRTYERSKYSVPINTNFSRERIHDSPLAGS